MDNVPSRCRMVHRLVRLLDEYVEAAGIADDSWGPLFRSSTGHNLGPRPMSVAYVAKMIRDRHEEAERLNQLSKRLNRIRMRRDRRQSTQFSVGGS